MGRIFSEQNKFDQWLAVEIAALEKAGVRVAERVPSIIAPLESTADYLRTKREKMGHLLG